MIADLLTARIAVFCSKISFNARIEIDVGWSLVQAYTREEDESHHTVKCETPRKEPRASTQTLPPQGNLEAGEFSGVCQAVAKLHQLEG